MARERLSSKIAFRLTPAELERLCLAAAQVGRPVSDYCRRVSKICVDRQLGNYVYVHDVEREFEDIFPTEPYDEFLKEIKKIVQSELEEQVKKGKLGNVQVSKC